MQFLLARYITYGTTVPGTLIDRVVSIGESPLQCVFRKSGHKVSFLKDGIDGHADSIRLLLNSRNYVNHNSEEHFMVRRNVKYYDVNCMLSCNALLYTFILYHILFLIICDVLYVCRPYIVLCFILRQRRLE